MRRTTASSIALLLVVLGALPRAQGTDPPAPLTLVTAEGRRTVPTTLIDAQEFITLADVAALFQVTVREDALAGGITISYQGRTIVATPDRSMVSVDGRLISLPAATVRSGQQWLVPVEFLQRALAPIYDRTIELRRASRLLLVGDVNVPRVTARIDAAGPPTRATIEISPAAQVTTTSTGNTVLLRIEADALDVALPATAGGLIEQIRPGPQDNTVTLVLPPAAGAARVDTRTTAASTIVTVDVPAAGTPLPLASAEAPGDPAAAPAAPPLLAMRRSALETIVIDPGHGGEDGGARGAGGLEEKQVTLDVARRLRTLIENQLGVRVLLTRDDDRAVRLDERAAVANNSKADLFLSLHLNAALSPAIGGVEVFHLQLDREGEDARRAAAADAVALPVLGGGTRSLDIVRWDMAQARYVDASARFASLLERELRRQVSMGPTPLQQAPLRVLTGANMPAALIELGYATNAGDERLLGSEEYRQRLAQGIYEAIVRFRGYLEAQRTE